MSKKITIAVDAMGGDNSPEKVVNGINIHFKNSQNMSHFQPFLAKKNGGNENEK